ncbi:DUF255 domain-containing protein [Paenibacillus monticola]|nr:DUF255 domain-containing protein [Paenibacillus monticola]
MKGPNIYCSTHNPVGWYSWGDEDFEIAKRDNKPILYGA